MIDFIVIGLPRSGTTWLANWLTTDTTVCYHDPFAHSLPEQLDGHGKRLGIACTGAYLFPDWLAEHACPVAIIERDPGVCDASLQAMGLPPTTALRKRFYAARGRRWSFDDIWNETKARELWAFLLPGIAFDAVRYRLLGEMQIQPHMGKWTPDQRITDELIRRLDAPQER